MKNYAIIQSGRVLDFTQSLQSAQVIGRQAFNKCHHPVSIYALAESIVQRPRVTPVKDLCQGNIFDPNR